MIMLLLACRPANPEGSGLQKDSAWSFDTSWDSSGPDEPAEILLSVADGQQVLRLRFSDGLGSPPETVWAWDLAQDFPGRDHKPHGLSVEGTTILVTCFDYFTDTFVVRLDLATGELLDVPRPSPATAWAGDPSRDGLRAAHNAIRSEDGFLISDTHNHRILAVDEDWELRWALTQETIGADRYLRRWWSNINDVERIELDNEPRLLASARGDSFNHVLLFSPTEPLRPRDPTWVSLWRWPEVNDPDQLYEPHNPRPISGGFTIADSGNDRIRAFSWTGDDLWTFPDRGCPESDFPLDWPRDALLVTDRILLISDSRGDKLVAVDLGAGSCLDDSTVLWTLPNLGGPYQVERL